MARSRILEAANGSRLERSILSDDQLVRDLLSSFTHAPRGVERLPVSLRWALVVAIVFLTPVLAGEAANYRDWIATIVIVVLCAATAARLLNLPLPTKVPLVPWGVVRSIWAAAKKYWIILVLLWGLVGSLLSYRRGGWREVGIGLLMWLVIIVGVWVWRRPSDSEHPISEEVVGSEQPYLAQTLDPDISSDLTDRLPREIRAATTRQRIGRMGPRATRGLAVLAVGGVLTLIGVIFLGMYTLVPDIDTWDYFAFRILIAVVPGTWFVAWRLTRSAKSMKSAPLAADPVLFLRPFSVDGRGDLEPILSRAVRPTGPLVAIGNPMEWLPGSSAVRIYATSDRWQDEVRDLLSRCRFCVIQLAVSKGVIWEVLQAQQFLTPDQLILVVLNPEENYQEVSASMPQVFGYPLPRLPVAQSGILDVAVVGFEADGQPHSGLVQRQDLMALIRCWVVGERPTMRSFHHVGEYFRARAVGISTGLRIGT